MAAAGTAAVDDTSSISDDCIDFLEAEVELWHNTLGGSKLSPMGEVEAGIQLYHDKRTPSPRLDTISENPKEQPMQQPRFTCPRGSSRFGRTRFGSEPHVSSPLRSSCRSASRRAQGPSAMRTCSVSLPGCCSSPSSPSISSPLRPPAVMVEQPSPSASLYSADDEESPSPGNPPCTIHPSPESNETDDEFAAVERAEAAEAAEVAALVAAAAEDAAAAKKRRPAVAITEDAAAATAEACVLVDLSPAQAQSFSPQSASPPSPVHPRRLTDVSRELTRLKRLLAASEHAEKESVISRIKRLVLCSMG